MRGIYAPKKGLNPKPETPHRTGWFLVGNEGMRALLLFKGSYTALIPSFP